MDAVPKITRAHVESALEEIQREGVPAGRGSTRFCLVVGARHYPPKYVVALAAKAKLGRQLRPDEFSGGAQTNGVLAALGLKVVECRCGGAAETRTNGESPKRTERPSLPTVKPSSGVSTANAEEVTVVRVIAKGRTPERPKAEEKMLLDVFDTRWPQRQHAKFVITPGGFVHGTFPRDWRGRAGWESRPSDAVPLFEAAEKQVAAVVTPRVLDAARGKADVLTIGIDLFDDRDPTHAELVGVFDVARRKLVGWTGKSYPTGDQQDTLVHVRDLDTHLFEIAGERVLVLGCHDLNMFSPRGHANQSPDGVRRRRCDEMKRKVAQFKPTVVLQHPHSTDTPNIWRLPWLTLAKMAPSVTCWASGIGYYNWNGKPRADLQRVRELTAGGSRRTQDIVVNSAEYA